MDDEELYSSSLIERICNLEEQLLKLQHILRFHGLDEIDLKYRKAFPSKNEYPFFEAPGFKKNENKFTPLGMSHVNKIPSENEREEAKKRVGEYAVLGKKHFRRPDEFDFRRQKEEEYWNKKREQAATPGTSEESSIPSPEQE